MKKFTIYEAKLNLHKLIEHACNGHEIVIADGSKHLVRLVPVVNSEGRRKPGALKGKLRVGPEFFEPLPPKKLAGCE